MRLRSLTAGAAATAVTMFAGVGVASAASISSVDFAPVSTLVRGGAAASNVTVQATESAQFQLGVAGAGVGEPTFTAPCVTSPVIECFLTDEGWATLLSDNDFDTFEPIQMSTSATLSGDPLTGLASTEGSTPPSLATSLTGSVTAIGSGTTGGPFTDPFNATIVGNPATDAEIRMTTTGPASTPDAPRGTGGVVNYTATLLRAGFTGQNTSVEVSLVADTPSGTTAGVPQTVAFAPGETSKTATVGVEVPAGATLGTASYRLLASWDPTGVNQNTTDTELGSLRDFEIVPGGDLSLSRTPATQSVGSTETASLDVTLSNAGPDPASLGGSGPRVVLALASTGGPGAATFTAATGFEPGSAGSCALSAGGTVATCDVASSMAASGTATIRPQITATGGTTATLTTTSVQSDAGDATPASLEPATVTFTAPAIKPPAPKPSEQQKAKAKAKAKKCKKLKGKKRKKCLKKLRKKKKA
jgi:hypothetical protein